MKLMSVTLEVFQLDMSALKALLPLKSPLMSVTLETSQWAMSAMSSSLSAAARSSLFANTLAGGEGEGGGGEGEGGGGDGERSGGGGEVGRGDGGGKVAGQVPEPQLEP